MQAALKENDQLKKAMKRNDSYIEELETKLRCCENSSACGSQTELQFHNSLNLTSSELIDDPLTQACDMADIFNDDQKNQLSTLIESSCPVYDETSTASSFYELQGFDNSNFTPPAPSEETDALYSSSRKLEFDQNPCDFLSNSQDSNSKFAYHSFL